MLITAPPTKLEGDQESFPLATVRFETTPNSRFSERIQAPSSKRFDGLDGVLATAWPLQPPPRVRIYGLPLPKNAMVNAVVTSLE